MARLLHRCLITGSYVVSYIAAYVVTVRTLALLVMVGAMAPLYADSSKDLVVLTWADYIDPDVVKEFEKRSGLTVKFFYYETDELREDILIENGTSGFDLVLVSNHVIESYQRRGWLEALDHNKLPNLRHLDNKWQRLFPESRGHGVPYAWGTVGIVYREDLVPEPIHSWKQLFNPAPELHGRIKMIKDTRELFSMALKSHGYSLNSHNMEELQAAGESLRQQKPFVKDYTYIITDESSGLLTGDIVAAIAYNGDALQLHDLNPAIRYVVPREGTNLWMDDWVIMKASSRKDNAYAFLDFISSPEIAAKNAQYVNFATPNRAAEKLLPRAFLRNPLIYPDAETLQRSEVYGELPAMSIRYQNNIFTELMR